MSEKDLQAAFVAAVQASPGARCYHTYDSRRSEPGFPDLVVCLLRPRGVWFLELKTEAGQLTSEQKEWGRTLEAVGANWRVVRPSNAGAVLAEMGLPVTMPALAHSGAANGQAPRVLAREQELIALGIGVAAARLTAEREVDEGR